MKTFALAPITILVSSALTLACGSSFAEEVAKTQAVSAASPQVQEISGATKKREATSGAFVLTQDSRMQKTFWQIWQLISFIPVPARSTERKSAAAEICMQSPLLTATDRKTSLQS